MPRADLDAELRLLARDGLTRAHPGSGASDIGGRVWTRPSTTRAQGK